MDDRRAAEAPLVLFRHGEAGIDGAHVALPELLAGEVVAIESIAAEAGDDTLAIGGDGAIGLAPLQMPLDLGNPLERLFVPENLARVALEAENVPGVLRLVVDGRDVAVIASTNLLIGL